MSTQNQQASDTEWSAPKLIGLGAAVLAAFFVFINFVSP